MKEPNNSRIVGVVVIVVTFFSLSQLLYFSYSNRQITQCQSEVNQAFLDVLKVRAEISDGDRANVRSLVTDIAKRRDFQKSLDEYYARDQKLEALRNSFQYPDITGSCDEIS